MASINDELLPLDGIDDEAYLQDLFDSIAQYPRQKSNVLNDLPLNGLARFSGTIDQIRTGVAMSDPAARSGYYTQWASW